MINEIVITKDLILSKYDKIDKFFKDCLKTLYNEESNILRSNYVIDKIINIEANNYLDKISDCSGYVGIYVFTDDKGFPQYIGKGGTSRKINGRDIKFRIGQELCKYIGNNCNTLSKNIINIDTLLENKKITPEESVEKIKKFNLIVLKIGERLNKNNQINLGFIKKTEALEKLLLAIFPTKYNIA